ncbi:uncharacterized protein LOC130684246 [Manis pentadactyla]|uniref:uncharacterized protein LOC130684246 n=1 Tax=Manis pentadactyla TaxID=143292 RepID=UPI00255C78DA|nr:uncharacterized protein LOC130684246 [Manis pentadactyla]
MREPGTYQSALLLFAQNATRSACSNYSQKRETEESAAYTRTQCAKLTPLASSFRILYATAETAWSAPTPGTREHCVCKAKPRAAVQLVRRRVESRAAAATRVRTRARHVGRAHTAFACRRFRSLLPSCLPRCVPASGPPALLALASFLLLFLSASPLAPRSPCRAWGRGGAGRGAALGVPAAEPSRAGPSPAASARRGETRHPIPRWQQDPEAGAARCSPRVCPAQIARGHGG